MWQRLLGATQSKPRATTSAVTTTTTTDAAQPSTTAALEPHGTDPATSVAPLPTTVTVVVPRVPQNEGFATAGRDILELIWNALCLPSSCKSPFSGTCGCPRIFGYHLAFGQVCYSWRQLAANEDSWNKIHIRLCALHAWNSEINWRYYSRAKEPIGQHCLHLMKTFTYW
ncbi:hypothetical protein Pelo_11003 [Pelomyxa schiedti]|nr:hypothetical protein Pelo_11003 [Pelomyxa schiedti]